MNNIEIIAMNNEKIQFFIIENIIIVIIVPFKFKKLFFIYQTK
jgi:hypothetical protein